jgi:hypothetical protein
MDLNQLLELCLQIFQSSAAIAEYEVEIRNCEQQLTQENELVNAAFNDVNNIFKELSVSMNVDSEAITSGYIRIELVIHILAAIADKLINVERVKGVRYRPDCGGKYQARVRVLDNEPALGTYNTLIEANAAQTAALQLLEYLRKNNLLLEPNSKKEVAVSQVEQVSLKEDSSIKPITETPGTPDIKLNQETGQWERGDRTYETYLEALNSFNE